MTKGKTFSGSLLEVTTKYPSNKKKNLLFILYRSSSSLFKYDFFCSTIRTNKLNKCELNNNGIHSLIVKSLKYNYKHSCVRFPNKPIFWFVG
ncbi:hypothetical protein BLOT_010431 [Blomia tropicalis]|nr:hypothetical protein BLOT_010431 [Blomia tropicalis]